MTNTETETALAEWRGRDAVDRDGGKLGSIDEIYMDAESGRPEWLAVKLGLFGSQLSFVPIAGAREVESGVQLPYEKEQIQDAPKAEADGELSPEEEAGLYRHYGLDYPEGQDTSGPTTDDAMTRSEEELNVGKTSRESGRARLRKYVVTEQVETTVPVQREEVRLEREPITESNADQATDGPEISEEEHEVTLHEEEVVVEKRTVPKERVHLGKETVTDDQQVSEEVRKEQIETEGTGDDASGRS
jgi:uncharacterized protein (TIGR02271 family)